MVTEESSVVAAAAAAAKFWQDRGGVKAIITSTLKLGQIHFNWNGSFSKLNELLPSIEKKLRFDATNLVQNMEARGGGISSFEFIQIKNIENYFQLRVGFETCDSMGANFINTCLESFAVSIQDFISNSKEIPEDQRELDIIMSILSNYTPDCLVKVSVECSINELGMFNDGMESEEFALRFYKAVQIAKEDPYRAVTHNKGILNGIDAVVIASGNDFRAVEACCHAYAARDGQYRSLSTCTLENNVFHFSMELPLALGTIGGLTNLHPMAKRSLELLEQPNAEQLMMITAATGLLQNFAAIKSLITTGIQKGHMKMHLENILSHLKANDEQRANAREYFKEKVISYNSVSKFIEE